MRYMYRTEMIENWRLEEGLNELRPGERLHSVLEWGNSMMAVFETALEDPGSKRRGGGGLAAAGIVSEPPTAGGKSPEAVALGARGGAARAKSLSPERRSEIAQSGGTAPRRKK